MKKYFVIDFKKVHNDAEYKNIVVGHNNRTRKYKNRPNINPEKTKENIVLVPLKFKNEKEIREFAKKNLARGRRQLQRGKAFAFNIVIDCSVMENWSEQDYINYLKDAFEFLKEHFRGQTIVNATIHLDESKPHLHATFLYFNEKEGKWNQKDLMKQKKTDLNQLLNEFEKQVGQKYKLKRGERENLDREFIKTLKKEKAIKKVKIKENIFSSKEEIVLDVEKTKKAIKKLNKQYKLAIAENNKLKEALIKEKREKEQIKEEINKLKEENILIKRENLMLSKKNEELEKTIIEQENENNLLKEKLEKARNYINNLINELVETKAKLSKNIDKAKTIIMNKIKENMPKI